MTMRPDSNSNIKRYARQTALPEIGSAGQKKLGAARVLCVGAGGLGSPALQYLAGAGIGTLGIVDGDRVDISNLHRQTLFDTRDEGQPKASTAAQKLRDVNPDITIQAYDEELTDKNALALFAGYDVILDGTDNFAAKFLINDAAVHLGKPVVQGAIDAFEGRVAVFGLAGGACYRCLHPAPPKTRIGNCAENGVMGALAGIVGAAQALEAVKIILGHASLAPLSGRLWMIDARTMSTSILSVKKNRNCPACAAPAQITLEYAPAACSAADIACAAADIACAAADIDWAAAESLRGAALFDVREAEEWRLGHVPGAKHLPLSALRENPSLLPVSGAPCVLYCQRGQRSRAAAEILGRAGHKNVYSVKGGYEAWAQRA